MLRGYNRPLLISHVIMATVVIFGFIRVEAIATDVNEEVERRQHGICQAYDDLVIIMRGMVNETASGTQQEDLANKVGDPELAEILKEAAQRNERFRSRVNDLLDESTCPVTNGGMFSDG